MSSSILDRDPQLADLRQSVLSRHGQPLTEFHHSRWVSKWVLQFSSGHVELTREGDGPWTIGLDTTSAQADRVVPSGPSSDTAPSARQSLAAALEAVQGSTAEETFQRE
jgi:hypothetical protein